MVTTIAASFLISVLLLFAFAFSFEWEVGHKRFFRYKKSSPSLNIYTEGRSKDAVKILRDQRIIQLRVEYDSIRIFQGL